MAIARRAGGSSAFRAAISTDGPANPAPPAVSTPIASTSAHVECANGVSHVPSAIIAAPATSTGALPYRVTSTPATGCVTPHIS